MAAGDMTVSGTIFCDALVPRSATLPAGCITDTMIAAGAGIDATKSDRRLALGAGQKNGTNNVAQRQVIHYVHGATGTLRKVYARNTTAASGGDSTVVQIKVNGSDKLSSAITLDTSASTTLQSTTGFTSASLVAGDVIEISVTLSGTNVGQGVFVEVVLDEDAA